MMYEWLGLCLALAALLAFNTAASGAAALLWRGVGARVAHWPAAARVQLLFTLRVLPTALALAVVLLILLPAYAAHEPRQSGEAVSLKLALLAAVSAAGLLLAAWRGAAAWWATRRLLRDWLQHAEPLALPQCALPAYRLRHPFPVLALVGTWRPRLFVAESLLAALTPAELAAALAHERGHLRAGDNGKRALLRACRDALTLLPCGRALDRAWDEAAEEAADEFAARPGPPAALELAGALVKIARLAPAHARPTTLASASFIGHEAGVLTRRVQRLLALAETSPARAERLPQRFAATPWLAAGALFTLTFLTLRQPALLTAAHEVLEFFVRGLQ